VTATAAPAASFAAGGEGVGGGGGSDAAPSPRSPYFVSAVGDFLLLGGASLVCFALTRLLADGVRTPTVISLGATLSWVVNWPHFAATNARLYGSRENLRQYPVTAVGALVLVVAGVVASLASPDVIAPWWVKLFMLWSPYHFSGQTVGLTLLYARRTGFAFTPAMRLSLSTFVFGSYLLPIVRFESSTMGSQYWDVAYPGLGVPAWTIDVVTAAMVAGALAFLVLSARRSLAEKRAPPPIVLLPAVAQFVWFLPGGSWATFAEFVPFFHSLQYMLIAWALQLKQRLDAGGRPGSGRFVLAESLRWYIHIVAGGALMFHVLPRFVADVAAVPLGLSLAVVVAGVQIHHFFVDGVIWKLRSSSVRSPLSGTLDELLGRERARGA
jgi:hypothetical protein